MYATHPIVVFHYSAMQQKHYNKEIHVFTVGSSLIITVSSVTTFNGLGRIHLGSECVLVPLHIQHRSRHVSEHDFS